MSIRRVTCPGCGTAANVPAALTNARCPSCGTVWNINQPVAPKPQPSEAEEKVAAAKTDTSGALAMAALVGGGLLLMILIGTVVIVVGRSPTPSPTAATENEETIKPRQPEPYRVVDLPEATRRRIYDDYRKVARTTVETPLILPQGTRPRKLLEDTLQKTYDRELNRFAALHDINVDDVQEIIKEGDAKNWDPTPRSNAVRDGKRVYPEEMSEGWERNPNRR